MFHRHFDDYVRHGHGPGGFGRGPFGGWRGRQAADSSAARAGCSTAAS